MEIRLLIGLGNPGKKYQSTRHNIGFQVLEELAVQEGFKIDQKKFKARYGLVELFGKRICCLAPETYMNLSGEVVRAFIDYYKVDLSHLLVIHDDIDLALGRCKFSYGAGPGGHNGVRSILDHVGEKDFYRLRLGVGRPPEMIDPARYVLSPFGKSERGEVSAMADTAVEAIKVFYEKGPREAMQLFNSVLVF